MTTPITTMVDEEHGVTIINESNLPLETVYRALRSEPEVAAIVKWSREAQGIGSPARREGTLFNRDRYVSPTNFFEEFQVARHAAEADDIVSSVLESTEALAFSRMAIECDDEDEADVWNQIAADLDMDARLREIWRETFIVSQCYVGIWWGLKSYKVRGKSDKGITRKRQFANLRVPVGVTVLDPLKIIPVGNFMFNQEDLVYVADRTEQDAIDTALGYGPAPRIGSPDQVISQLILKKYTPIERDRRQLAGLGVDINALYLMNPKSVFRHTATRSQYQRFATTRLKSLFELLDLKHQLRQMDRAHLVGGTNFIVLIRKGSDNLPATQPEIDHLQGQMRTVAQLPVLVGDHRLDVKIVTPAQDHTLDGVRYHTLDSRIASRLYGMLMPASPQGRSADDSIKLARVIARTLESRRHMQRRTIEARILRPTFDLNADFTKPPNLRFYPKRIALDFDPALATFLFDLWQGGALSRESILSEADYSQADEARKREVEKDKYDKTFEPTALPPGSPGANPAAVPAANPKTAGRTQGGNRKGGGAAPGTGQGKPPVRPGKTSPGSQDGRKQKATRADLHAQLDDWLDDNEDGEDIE